MRLEASVEQMVRSVSGCFGLSTRSCTGSSSVKALRPTDDITQHAPQNGELVPGGERARMLWSQHPLLHRKQLGTCVDRTGHITRHACAPHQEAPGSPG
ncbi:hypothetical protein [Streptomyces sp. NPDC051098]|uniref:hypothetical protein n=1 Tax=Streptomyces sp. NPDC051098 TaxID=3155411 RepID=UPI00342692C6